MAFTVPDFNQAFDLWASAPVVGPPLYSAMCQLYVHPKPYNDITPGDPLAWVPAIYIRVPKTFIDDTGTPIVGAVFGIRDQSGNVWYYLLRWWERIHANFPNEYLQLLVEQCSSAGTTPDNTR